MPTAPDIAATRADFIEKCGLFAQADGLPRIAGRVLGMLIFDGEAVPFGDLATRLLVSRASISTSIRLLEERGLVKRLSKPGERQDYFQLASEPYVTMLEGIQKRTQATQREITQTINALPSGVEAAERVGDFADFYASTDAAIGLALVQMRQRSQTDHTTMPSTPKDNDDEI